MKYFNQNRGYGIIEYLLMYQTGAFLSRCYFFYYIYKVKV